MHRGGLLAAFLAGPRHPPPNGIGGSGEQAAQVARWATARRRTHSLATRTLERSSQDESGRLLERPMWRTRLELEQRYQQSAQPSKPQMEWIPVVAPRTTPRPSSSPRMARMETAETHGWESVSSTSQSVERKLHVRHDRSSMTTADHTSSDPVSGSSSSSPIPKSRHSITTMTNVIYHTPSSPCHLLPDPLQKLLRKRHFRQLVFTVLHDPLLRSNVLLVHTVGRRLALVSKDGAASSAGAARLALRLGYVKGRRRGPAWEELHQLEVVQHGRLPSEDRVRKAMALDSGSKLVLPKFEINSSIARCNSSSWAEERWTVYYNTLLDRYLQRAGSRATSRSRITHPPNTDPPPRSGHDPPRPPSRTPLPVPPPSLDLRPLSRLVRVINKLRNTRGFQPNGVTAAILLKCWIRCLSVEPMVKDHHGLWSGGKDLWELFKKTEMVVKGMDRRLSERLPVIAENEVALQASFSSPASIVDYGTHIRPIGRMFIKAFRGKGRHDLSNKVIYWMRVYREREQGRRPGSEKEG